MRSGREEQRGADEDNARGGEVNSERDGPRPAVARDYQGVEERDEGHAGHEPRLGPRADEREQDAAEDAEGAVPEALDRQVGAGVAAGVGGDAVAGGGRGGLEPEAVGEESGA
ncbi:hypothetical protein Shyhy01_47700 [Streptomyces hygroscopicus subsp. hygroscopicus]|nr:hypothetical protein Shyhy01_47700 [Streptomyces hygroscopicus subsp. hygroscopicus]